GAAPAGGGGGGMRSRGRGGGPRRPPGVTQAQSERAALRELVDAGVMTGLVGYRDGTPVGWVSLGPREDYAKLRRSPVMKAVDDAPVWSIVCFVVPAAHRGQGVATALLEGAVAWARKAGVTLLEAYPVDRADRSHDHSTC